MSKDRRTSRARSPEQWENEIINLAYKLAEKKLRDGTASSQLICEWLRRGSEKSRLENEKLRADVEVAHAKIKQMEKTSISGELYRRAIQAFQKYSGQEVTDDIEPFDDDDYDD